MLPATSHPCRKQKSSSAQVDSAISLLVDARSLLLRTSQRLTNSRSASDTQRRIDEAIKAIDETGTQLYGTQL